MSRARKRTAAWKETDQRTGRLGARVTTWLHWHHPGGAFVLSTAAHLIIAAYTGGLSGTSGFAWFNYQARAFLQGHLHLTTLPPSLHDLSLFNGQYHLYWQPFPAAVLMPFVALFGTGFSDVLFNAVLGGINVALIALLLERASAAGLVATTASQRGLLTLTFALGTVHLPLAVLGRVWFTAQIVGFTCVALAYLASVTLHGPRACLAVGAAIGCATLTRSHLVFAGIWPVALLWQRWRLELRERRGPLLLPLLGRAALVALPVLAAIALVLLFNELRFGDPFESGVSYQIMDDLFRRSFDQWGVFSLHYLPTNVFYQYVFYPFPLDAESFMGGSLFLLTPLLASVFWAFSQPLQRWSPWVLAASIGMVAVPILLLMGTGWRQWGPRYTLDFTVPLMLLAAGGIGRWPPWITRVAAAIAVAHYVIGSVLFAASLS